MAVNVVELEKFYRELTFGIKPPHERLHRTCIVIEGFYVDPYTGLLRGRHLDLDDNVRGHFCPIYYYNRSWRFIGLFNLFKLSFPDQNTVLKYFENIEKAWEQVKGKYTRVYFLTQKLILQEICKRLSIQSTQDPKRPISDLRRYRAQIAIFNDLWKIVLDNKNVETVARRQPAVRPRFGIAT